MKHEWLVMRQPLTTATNSYIINTNGLKVNDDKVTESGKITSVKYQGGVKSEVSDMKRSSVKVVISSE